MTSTPLQPQPRRRPMRTLLKAVRSIRHTFDRKPPIADQDPAIRDTPRAKPSQSTTDLPPRNPSEAHTYSQSDYNLLRRSSLDSIASLEQLVSLDAYEDNTSVQKRPLQDRIRDLIAVNRSLSRHQQNAVMNMSSDAFGSGDVVAMGVLDMDGNLVARDHMARNNSISRNHSLSRKHSISRKHSMSRNHSMSIPRNNSMTRISKNHNSAEAAEIDIFNIKVASSRVQGHRGFKVVNGVIVKDLDEIYKDKERIIVKDLDASYKFTEEYIVKHLQASENITVKDLNVTGNQHLIPERFSHEQRRFSNEQEFDTLTRIRIRQSTMDTLSVSTDDMTTVQKLRPSSMTHFRPAKSAIDLRGGAIDKIEGVLQGLEQFLKDMEVEDEIVETSRQESIAYKHKSLDEDEESKDSFDLNISRPGSSLSVRMDDAPSIIRSSSGLILLILVPRHKASFAQMQRSQSRPAQIDSTLVSSKPPLAPVITTALNIGSPSSDVYTPAVNILLSDADRLREKLRLRMMRYQNSDVKVSSLSSDSEISTADAFKKIQVLDQVLDFVQNEQNQTSSPKPLEVIETKVENMDLASFESTQAENTEIINPVSVIVQIKETEALLSPEPLEVIETQAENMDLAFFESTHAENTRIENKVSDIVPSGETKVALSRDPLEVVETKDEKVAFIEAEETLPEITVITIPVNSEENGKYPINDDPKEICLSTLDLKIESDIVFINTEIHSEPQIIVINTESVVTMNESIGTLLDSNEATLASAECIIQQEIQLIEMHKVEGSEPISNLSVQEVTINRSISIRRELYPRTQEVVKSPSVKTISCAVMKQSLTAKSTIENVEEDTALIFKENGLDQIVAAAVPDFQIQDVKPEIVVVTKVQLAKKIDDGWLQKIAKIIHQKRKKSGKGQCDIVHPHEYAGAKILPPKSSEEINAFQKSPEEMETLFGLVDALRLRPPSPNEKLSLMSRIKSVAKSASMTNLRTQIWDPIPHVLPVVEEFEPSETSLPRTAKYNKTKDEFNNSLSRINSARGPRSPDESFMSFPALEHVMSLSLKTPIMEIPTPKSNFMSKLKRFLHVKEKPNGKHIDVIIASNKSYVSFGGANKENEGSSKSLDTFTTEDSEENDTEEYQRWQRLMDSILASPVNNLDIENEEDVKPGEKPAIPLPNLDTSNETLIESGLNNGSESTVNGVHTPIQTSPFLVRSRSIASTAFIQKVDFYESLSK